MGRSAAVIVMTAIITALFVSSVFAEVTFDYGAAFRLRQEIWDNVTHLGINPNDRTRYDRNFFRLRTQLWGKVDIDKSYGAYLRITNEAKYYNGPYLLPQDGNTAFKHVEEDEVFVDNLYLDFKNIAGLPVDARLGRQDFLGEFGDGFLIMDGNPGDGSRSFYFNAAKAIIRPHQNHSLTLIYLSNTKTDKYMPNIHSSINSGNYFQDQRILNVSNETGFIAYSKNTFGFVTIDPYYIYKTEDKFTAPGSPTTPRLHVNTVGARVEAKPDNFTIKAEYAHQFGEYSNNTKRTGDGANLSAGYAFKMLPLRPELEFGYTYLSGDDAATTTKNETWDPLFSRAPMWNELYIYTTITETLRYGGAVPGYWTNLNIYRANLKLNVTDATGLMLGYNYLRAAELTSPAVVGTAIYSNSSKERGHLFQGILTHKFTKKLDAMVQLEHFLPGDFYTTQTRNATFFRWQLQFKI